MSVPAGCMMPFAGSEDDAKRLSPTWLLCDGTPQDKNVYPDLFEALGTAWGGDGNPSFNLPDTRGYFLRGVDQGQGVDPNANLRTHQAEGGHVGDMVGTVQQDEYASHQHGYNDEHQHGYVKPGDRGNVDASGDNPRVIRGDDATTDAAGGDKETDASGGKETRPKNIYVHYIIKATDDD